jgi:folate-binding protein YgfZ
MTPGERALRASAATVPLERAVFRLTGERPLAYLHDVLAQDVAGLTEDRGALAVALDPKGRVSAELRVLLTAGGVLIDAEEAARGGIEERIGRHALLAGAELEDLSAEFAVVGVRGPGADEAIVSAGLPAPPSGETAFARHGYLLVVRVAWGVPGVDLVGPRDAVEAAVERLGLDEAAPAELDALRIAAGRPRFGVDIDESVLVNETPLLVHAVALDKGCYPGQESVARIHNLGGVRRTLRGLRSSGSISAGADVARDGATVGVVRSAASLPEGGSAAIAHLRSEISPGAVVDAGGVDADVTALD